MNPTERVGTSYPSRIQIETLLDFLEKNPKSYFARETARKTWDKLAVELNNLKGCVKSWKQWTKDNIASNTYWADKKCAVKRKGALQARQFNNETNSETEVVELSDIEERIFALLKGVTSTIDKRHVDLNSYEEIQVSQDPYLSDDGNSIQQEVLANHLVVLEAVPLTKTEPLSTPSETSLHLADTFDTDIKVENLSPSSPLQIQTPPPIVDVQVSPDLLTTPPNSNIQRKLNGYPPLNNPPNATTAGRRRWRRQSLPPFQTQLQFANLTHRLLRLEEQRTQIMQSYLNRQIERDRSVAKALHAIGKGLKLLAEAIKK